MSIACSSGKIGMVMFMDDKLVLMKISVHASKSAERAKKQAKKWIDQYKPDCIVSERLDEISRKHGRTPELIEAIKEAIAKEPIKHKEVRREQKYPNKYEEANTLVERYPQLKPYLPDKRKIWNSEDRRMALFEAVIMIASLT